MKSLWNDEEAARLSGDLARRVYTSRLLGADPALVLHGGGNTSVKTFRKNLFGDEEQLLYVKGSGWDLASIEEAGFAPVRMAHLLRLSRLDELSDPDMVRELRLATADPMAPSPSVEAILHAILPYKYVDHTHADAIVTLTNTPDGEERIRRVYEERVVIIPYVMPGFDLARLCASEFPRQCTDATIGMVLMNHGIFSFADDARTSYERMIELVGLAERYLADNGAWTLPEAKPRPVAFDRLQVAQLRQTVSRTAGQPMTLTVDADPRATAFAQRNDLERVACRGPATPDHVIRTKRVPLIGRDVAAYRTQYAAYFHEYEPGQKERKLMLDAAPRVILDRELGLLTVGRSAKDAAIVADIYHHTIEVILRAEALAEYRALSAGEIFSLEYWDLEQAKLRSSAAAPVFRGENVLITGAGSGIGRACVDTFLARGAAVVGLDIAQAVTTLYHRADYLGIECDVTDEAALDTALDATVRCFGGLDMLVLNAGVFPGARPVCELDTAQWRRVMAVNLDANLALLRLCHPLLRCAPNGGRVAVVGSKNVTAPGPGAAAYSASKAALNQLTRVAALEWAGDGIRLNTLHPDAVFDTGLWTDEVLKSRATSYGMSVEQYKTKNLLHVEVTSRDVAELAALLCGPQFSRTTGAQIPVDGGNDRVI